MKWSALVPAIISTLYAIAVLFVTHHDRANHSGGFVSLRGLETWIATLPGSLLFDPLLGHFDLESNFHVGLSLLLTAALIFLIVFLILKLFRVQ